ncbi:MAG: hypothetical protein SWJ54_12940 [Cyanobacteriota bacterium]|nr:hypothetical protein [Cyanobacteriota bacterium]
MSDEYKESEENIKLAVQRRTLSLSLKIEENVEAIRRAVIDLEGLTMQQKSKLEELRVAIKELKRERMTNILLGIAIGLAGRQILKDILELIIDLE